MKGNDKQKPVRQNYSDKKKMPPMARRQFLEAINLLYWRRTNGAIMAELTSARKSKNDQRRVAHLPAGADGFAVAEAVQRSGRIRPEGGQPEGPGRVRGGASDSRGGGQDQPARGGSVVLPPAAGGSPALPAGLTRSPGNKVSTAAQSQKPALDGDQEELDEKRRSARREAWIWRRRAQDSGLFTLDRLLACGRRKRSKDVPVDVRITTMPDGKRTAGVGNVQHCGSIWCCFACARKIAKKRADELSSIMRKALSAGGSATMVTMTIRHTKDHSLRELWKAVMKAWKASISGREWMRVKQTSGLIGWVRVVEVTYGRNGWHVHIHALMIWREDVSLEDATKIAKGMHDRWTSKARELGFDSWRESGGFDVRKADLKKNGRFDYFHKLAREITHGHAKVAKGKGRTPYQLIRDALTDGVADECEAVVEWEQESNGKRQVGWSRGEQDLRKWAELGEEATDEEIANEELPVEEVIKLTDRTWATVQHPNALADLIEAAERGGIEAAIAWLDARRLAWFGGGRQDVYPCGCSPGSVCRCDWGLNQADSA